MVCGASATGIPLSHMIIFPKSFHGGTYTFEGPDDGVYAKSDLGCVDSNLFLLWMKKSFYMFVVPEHPLMVANHM